MNPRLLIFSFLLILSFACGKEYSCEGCLPNNPPPPTTPPPPPVDPPVTINCEPIDNLITKISFAAQSYHNLAVLSDGTVKSWGENLHGCLGDGTTTHRSTPVLVVGLTNIIAVAAGEAHSLALDNDGKVWVWGNNETGQLGNGTNTDSHIPVRLSSLSDIVAISAGFDFSIALKKDGTLWAWGNNVWGVLGDGSYTNKSSPVQVNLCKVVSIAVGLSHVVAVKNDGTVWTWGWNLNGTLGDGSSDIKRSIPGQVPGLTNIKSIAANGAIHTIALKNDGSLWAWGENYQGQLGNGTQQHQFTPIQLSITNVAAIGNGAHSSFAIQQDGKVWAWGWNTADNLGIEIFNSSVALSPLYISQLTDVKAITGGAAHTLVQKNNGSVWSMGGNAFGQLGDGSSVIYRWEAKPVPGL
jgi:alpha-tubulin suppressor-like RCC1 family protein